jgi:oligopeptide transport system ATP-binding protein
MSEKLLEINNLHTLFQTDAGTVQAVRGVTFSVDKGESVGIVGESGCGKSVTMLSIMQLLDDYAKIEADSILFEGEDLLKKTPKAMRHLEGDSIGMIFQDPMTSLNPLFSVGDQIMEPLRIHKKMSRAEARKKAINMLELVGISSPESRLKQFPHEFSGGMRQRVMIAIAMCCDPKLLIADEPTTALDVTIQAQILDLMRTLKDQFDTSIVMITHDLGVIANLCSRVIVMYAGLIMEQGSLEDIFYRTAHPYTLGLLKSIPKNDGKRLVPIYGTPPDLIHPPKGCPFAGRCENAMKICGMCCPPLTTLDGGHSAACWLLHRSAPKVERSETVHAG